MAVALIRFKGRRLEELKSLWTEFMREVIYRPGTTLLIYCVNYIDKYITR